MVSKRPWSVQSHKSYYLDAKEAYKIWGHAENYVHRMYMTNPQKFPEGSIRKFGNQWVVTSEGMEAVTGMQDPRNK